MNMLHTTLALKYTKAFMNVFIEDITKKDIESLDQCAQFLSKKQDLLFFLNISLINTTEKERHIEKICETFNLSSPYKKLCMLVIQHQRSILLPIIFIMIKDLYMKIKKEYHFTITTSQELTAIQKIDVQNFLKHNVSGNISCEYTIDLSLIAGIRMSNGVLLWEDSIKKRLKKFKNALRN